MKDFSEFVTKHGFRLINGVYAGTYNDMHLTVYEDEGQLHAHLYLDLPAGSKRQAILAEFLERRERYAVDIRESANKNFIRFVFESPDTAVSRMERFFSECDSFIRRYGREMGVLCARCRSEIKEGKMDYLPENDEIVPVCEMCLNAPGGRAARADNRRVDARRRARRGIIGAFIGTLISAVLWAVFTYFGVSGYYIPAMAIPFIVDYFYMRSGGIADKWRFYMVLLFSFFAILAGNVFAGLIQSYEILKAIEASAMMEGLTVQDLNVYVPYGSFVEYYASQFSIKILVIQLLPSWIFSAIGAHVSTRGNFFRR